MNYALATYEKGNNILKGKFIFAYEMGNIYSKKGNIPKMIDSYLNSLEFSPNHLKNVQVLFQQIFSKKSDFDTLKEQLYERFQQKPDSLIYLEMIVWTHIQQKDFSTALAQAKILDQKRQTVQKPSKIKDWLI